MVGQQGDSRIVGDISQARELAGGLRFVVDGRNDLVVGNCEYAGYEMGGPVTADGAERGDPGGRQSIPRIGHGSSRLIALSIRVRVRIIASNLSCPGIEPVNSG